MWQVWFKDVNGADALFISDVPSHELAFRIAQSLREEFSENVSQVEVLDDIKD